MYIHPQTKDGEYPRTAREVLHYSLDLLCEQFPDRVIDRVKGDEHIFDMPAYSWSGAGSEKGGSAEHIRYEEVVFLPEKDGRVFLLSAGDKQFDYMNTALIYDDESGSNSGRLYEYDVRSGGVPAYYSVLFRYSVSPRFADVILEYYHKHVEREKERSFTFQHVFEKPLEEGTSHYVGCPLFAVDSGRNGNFYSNKYGMITQMYSDFLVPVSANWRDCLGGDFVRRLELSESLASFFRGEQVNSEFLDPVLLQAFRGRELMIMGRSSNLNAFDSHEEERALEYLAKHGKRTVA